jgi:hypothetical protein
VGMRWPKSGMGLASRQDLESGISARGSVRGEPGWPRMETDPVGSHGEGRPSLDKLVPGDGAFFVCIRR